MTIFLFIISVLPIMAQSDSTEVTIKPIGSKFLGLIEFTVSVTGGQEGVPVFQQLFDSSEFASVDTEALRQFREARSGRVQLSVSWLSVATRTDRRRLGFFFESRRLRLLTGTIFRTDQWGFFLTRCKKSFSRQCATWNRPMTHFCGILTNYSCDNRLIIYPTI